VRSALVAVRSVLGAPRSTVGAVRSVLGALRSTVGALRSALGAAACAGRASVLCWSSRGLSACAAAAAPIRAAASAAVTKYFMEFSLPGFEFAAFVA
jgi:hypothetical protein